MSTDYRKAFDALKQRREWTPSNHVAIEVKGFEGKPADIIKGVALNGPNAGEEMRIRLSKDAHVKAPAVSEFYKKNTLVSIAPGGVIQAESLTKAKDGVFESRWLSVLSKNPEKNPIHLDVWASVEPAMKYDRETRTRVPVTDAKGVQRFSVRAFAPEQEIQAKSIDEFKAAIAEAVGKPPVPAQEGSRGVAVTLAAPDGASTRIFAMRGYEERKGDAPASAKPVEDLVSAVMDRFQGEENLKAFLADGVKIGVAPFAIMTVGGKSAEKLVADMAANDGRGRSIDTTNIANPGGASVPGYAKATIVTGSFLDDEGNSTKDSFVYRLARVDSSKPLPLEAINSPVLPDAAKNWRAEEEKRLQGQAQAAGAAQEAGGKPDADASESKPAEKKAEAAAPHEDYDEAAELDQILGMVENLPAERDGGPEM